MNRALPIALLLSLGACAAPGHPRVVGGTDAPCHADGLDDLVGQPGSSALAADALKRSGAHTLRWIQPGMAVTMDYRRDRLDIHLNDHNLVTRITCG
jgi:hypothetical protein